VRKKEENSMSYELAAKELAARLRNTKASFLTMRRDELRDAFGIGRLTEGLSTAVCEALQHEGLQVFPKPVDAKTSLRVYDTRHVLGQLIGPITDPDQIPDTALRTASEVFEREAAGRDLRSDDAPWLVAFDIYLQLAIGRELEEWEHVKLDHHPLELKRELGAKLGIAEDVDEDPATVRLAAAVCQNRPLRRRWFPRELIRRGDVEESLYPMTDLLAAAYRAKRDAHDRLLNMAAKYVLSSEHVPHQRIELGLLGLRFRREAMERNYQK
jgi:hypothetical protein